MARTVSHSQVGRHSSVSDCVSTLHIIYHALALVLVSCLVLASTPALLIKTVLAHISQLDGR